MGPLDRTLKEAYEYLRVKCKVKPFGEVVEKLAYLFMSSTKPSIKPYHIEPPDPLISSILPKLDGPLFLEPKYDGTHVLFCKSGIFKHDGDPVTKDQLAGLLYIAGEEPMLIEPIIDGLNEYFFAVEMFGSAFTPMGVHKDHPKTYTMMVFEVGSRGEWIPPPMKYGILSKLGVGYVKAEKQISPLNYQGLIEYLEEEVKGFTGEGLVVKASAKNYAPRSRYELQYIKPGGLFIFKYKKPGFKKVLPKREEKGKIIEKRLYEVPEEAKDEILNELYKIKAEEGEEYLNVARNMPLILDRVISHLKTDHPMVWEKCAGISERDLKKNIVFLLQEVKR